MSELSFTQKMDELDFDELMNDINPYVSMNLFLLYSGARKCIFFCDCYRCKNEQLYNTEKIIPIHKIFKDFGFIRTDGGLFVYRSNCYEGPLDIRNVNMGKILEYPCHHPCGDIIFNLVAQKSPFEVILFSMVSNKDNIESEIFVEKFKYVLETCRFFKKYKFKIDCENYESNLISGNNEITMIHQSKSPEYTHAYAYACVSSFLTNIRNFIENNSISVLSALVMISTLYIGNCINNLKN